MTENDLPAIQIQIDPNNQDLQAWGISREAFEAALSDALDEVHDRAESAELAGERGSVLSIHELKVAIGGREIPVEAVATITVIGL